MRLSETIGQTIDRLNDRADSRTVAEMKAEDLEFDEGWVTKVEPYKEEDGFTVSWKSDDGCTYGLGITAARNPNKITPEVGDRIRVYGRFGSTFYGIDLNGVEVFWETEIERAATRVNWLADYDRRKREDFAQKQSALDAQFERLSPPMQARIERFRAEREDFRIDSEAYEMFACEEAEKIAAHLKPQVDAGADPAEVVAAFHGLPYEETREVVSDQHSGNTFGGACSMARALLEGTAV